MTKCRGVEELKQAIYVIRHDMHERVLIIGNMNAVTRKWVEERGREKLSGDGGQGNGLLAGDRTNGVAGNSNRRGKGG